MLKDLLPNPVNPLPNDDLDLQLAWLHALENIGPYNINAATLGEFWISYITPHWKEYGIAKANMKRGLIPPVSGEYDNIWSKSNGAYAVIGLLYGEGDFKKSVLIAINCGDDTDCTAATAGATLGILYGNAGIPSDWREYIGDKIITVSLSQGCVGGTLPKSCSELSRRVVAMAPSVLQMHNARYDLSREYKLEFGEQEISVEMPSLLKKAVSKKVKPSLEKFKRYTMHFEKAFLTADVTLSSLKIAPMGEVNIHINFGTNLSYENQPHSVSLKWILPEGFRVEGEKSLFIQEFNGRTNSEAEYDFRLVAGENVSSENRIVLEVIPHGRHTAMYISFLILG